MNIRLAPYAAHDEAALTDGPWLQDGAPKYSAHQAGLACIAPRIGLA